MSIKNKLNMLESILRDCGSGVLAFSGGVDSTFLARVAVDVLGDRVLLVTATSPTYTVEELEQARQLAAEFGARHRVVETEEFNDPRFLDNPPDRCYLCKSELLSQLDAIRREAGLDCLFEGANADDVHDFRPGARAVREFKARSPLREAGLTKVEIRELSRERGLPTWNQPPRACLASRFPYGAHFTPDAMQRIAQAEAYLYSLNFSVARVRHLGDTARIEVTEGEIQRFADKGLRDGVVENLRRLGYTYVTVDLCGYRTGSMNETLTEEERRRGLGQEDG